MNKNIAKKIKNFSGKYCQKLRDHTKQSSSNTLNCVKKAIQKTATGNTIGNKIADKTTTVSTTSPQDSLEKIRNEHEKEIPKERYISPRERQKISDDLRSI